MLASLYNKIRRKRGRLSETEYLFVKEFEDKIVRISETISGSNATYSYVVPTGKTAYLYYAFMEARNYSIITMYRNSTSIGTAGTIGGSSGWKSTTLDLSLTLDRKLVGDGTNAFTFTMSSGSNALGRFNLVLLVEDTGTSPAA